MKYLSASSLTNYLKCPRSAVLQALGLRKGATAAQARGTALHAALEEYLLGNTPTVEDDLGDFARTNGLLPRPGSNIFVEYGIGEPNQDAERYAETVRWTGEPVVLAGKTFRGIVDLVRLDRGRLEIWDHKTTSSWYWAETADSLRENLQMWAYAEQMCRYLEIDDKLPPGPITLGHLQYKKTKRPKADDVRGSAWFETNRQEVAHKWRLIEDLAAAFVDDVEKALVDIRPDRSHCGAYGGCDFKSFCHLVPTRDCTSDAPAAAWKTDLTLGEF